MNMKSIVIKGRSKVIGVIVLAIAGAAGGAYGLYRWYQSRWGE